MASLELFFCVLFLFFFYFDFPSFYFSICFSTKRKHFWLLFLFSLSLLIIFTHFLMNLKNTKKLDNLFCFFFSNYFSLWRNSINDKNRNFIRKKIIEICASKVKINCQTKIEPIFRSAKVPSLFFSFVCLLTIVAKLISRNLNILSDATIKIVLNKDETLSPLRPKLNWIEKKKNVLDVVQANFSSVFYFFSFRFFLLWFFFRSLHE